LKDVIEVVNDSEEDKFEIRFNGQAVAEGDYDNKGSLYISDINMAKVVGCILLGPTTRILQTIELNDERE
jgi:hypothetical protein